MLPGQRDGFHDQAQLDRRWASSKANARVVHDGWGLASSGSGSRSAIAPMRAISASTSFLGIGKFTAGSVIPGDSP